MQQHGDVMPNATPRGIVFACALVGTAAAAACDGGSASLSPAEQAHEQSLVVIGRAGTASGAPIANAVVTMQVMSNGKRGGQFGCTGDLLVGQWVVQPPRDGLFTHDLRVTATSAPMCLIVLSMRSGDAVWRDTTTMVKRFSDVTGGIVPDTVRLDLRFSP
jgi:hypothetical protein